VSKCNNLFDFFCGVTSLGRVRIKFCGITNLEDALDADCLGVDALGFVFYKPSPRYIAPLVAAQIIEKLSPFVSTVGLFVNATHQEVSEISELTKIDMLQYHGDESPEYCESSSSPWIKALRVGGDVDITGEVLRFRNAKAILFDSYDVEKRGGTGTSFDWSLIPDQVTCPTILAGGLNPKNIGNAIRHVEPSCVDVSGGIEASKGVKDREKMKDFVAEVNKLDI
jgi:phosphoribosylanthranilate isomerase